MPALALVLIVLCTVSGDYFLKRASERPSALTTLEFGLGALLYMATALGFVVAMRHMSLTAIGVWYAVLTVLLMTALGVLAFGERLDGREATGVVMALGAIALLARHA